MLANLKQAPRPEPEPPRDSKSMQERFAGFVAAGDTSQRDAAPGEFVFEAFLGDQKDYDWGMNIKSCGICYSFSKYDAMNLVPYMCATDDLMSDIGEQGLRRSGTIAVGALVASQWASSRSSR